VEAQGPFLGTRNARAHWQHLKNNKNPNQENLQAPAETAALEKRKRGKKSAARRKNFSRRGDEEHQPFVEPSRISGGHRPSRAPATPTYHMPMQCEKSMQELGGRKTSLFQGEASQRMGWRGGTHENVRKSSYIRRAGEKPTGYSASLWKNQASWLAGTCPKKRAGVRTAKLTRSGDLGRKS